MRAVKFIVTLLIILSVSPLAFAQPPLPDIPGGTIVASGFTGPQGVLVDPDGNVWVVDSGTGGDEVVQVPGENGEMTELTMGTTARIVQVAPDGTQTDAAILPSILFVETGESSGGARLALLDGVLYATSGGWESDGSTDPPSLTATIVRVEGGEAVQVADMWAYEKTNNPDGLILESHPYGMAAGPDGWLWVADAGANDLLRVNPATGEIVLVTAFDGLPGAFPNPRRNDAVEADPVPTGVAFDDAGNAYVSLLSGAPFIPGSTKVLMVTPEGAVSDFATGLTMLTDLTRGPDGQLYAIQFGLFSEQGPTPELGRDRARERGRCVRGRHWRSAVPDRDRVRRRR